ncbi:MAG: Ig-like domain-containing protein [Candidatus Omnitrophica bacterium]|nr:Ig-like domain-containing protein [Candidatus Omnitrophota bacterium]
MVTIKIPEGVAQDASANTNTESVTLSRTYSPAPPDTTRPTITSLTTTASEPTSSASIPVTLVFSESVTGLLATEITVTNGSVSGLSGSGTNYSFTVTASAAGVVTIKIPEGVAQDASANTNTESVTLSRTYSPGARPRATLSGVPSDPTQATSVTITVGGAGVNYYKVKIDRGSTLGSWDQSGVMSISNPRIILSGLGEGRYTVSVIGGPTLVVDNRWQDINDPTVATWAVDILPVAVLDAATVPTGTLYSHSATIRVTNQNDVYEYKYKLDTDAEYTSYRGVNIPISLDNIPAGRRTLSVVGKDNDGNEQQAPTEVSWEVAASPEIKSALPSETDQIMIEGSTMVFSVVAFDSNDTQLTYTWSLDNDRVSQITVSTISAATETASSYTYSPGFKAAGRHTLKVEVSDGHESSLPAVYEWAVAVNEAANEPVLSWEFNTEGNNEGWVNGGGLGVPAISSGTYKADFDGAEPVMTGPSGLNISTSAAKTLRVRYRVSGGITAQLSWATDAVNENTGDLIRGQENFPIIGDGRFHAANVYLGEHPDWQGNVTGISFYPVSEAAVGEIEIDYIRFTDMGPSSSPDWEFNDNNAECWSGHGNIATPFTFDNGKLVTEVTGNDPIMDIGGVSIDADIYKGLEIRYRLKGGSNSAEIFWRRELGGQIVHHRLQLPAPIKTDGLFHTYSIDLSTNPYWQGEVVYFRFDPTMSGSPGIIGEPVEVEVDYIKLVASSAAAPVWEFDEEGEAGGWRNHVFDDQTTHMSDFEISNGTLKTRVTGSNSFMEIGYENPNQVFTFNADGYKGISIRMKVDKGRVASVSWLKDGSYPRSAFNIIADGQFHTYDIDFSGIPQWSGDLSYLRFNPIEGATGLGANVEIEYIRIIDQLYGPRWEFDDDGDMEGWVLQHSLSAVEGLPAVVSGRLKAEITGGYPSMYIRDGVSFSAVTFPHVQIRYRVIPGSPTGELADAAQLHWGARDAGNNWIAGTKDFSINSDGLWHVASIDLSQEANWKDGIVYLRYDPVEGVSSGAVEVDYIRFSHYRPPVTDLPEWSFNIDGNAQGWSPYRYLDDPVVEDGRMQTRVTGITPYMYGPLGEDIDADAAKGVEIKYRISGDLDAFPSLQNDPRMRLLWIRDGESYSASRMKVMPIEPDGQYHTLTIPLGSDDNWSGIVKRLRIHPLLSVSELRSGELAGADLYAEIDYIKITDHLAPHYWEFDEADNTEGWTPRHSLSDFTVSYNEDISSGTLLASVTNADPYMSVNSVNFPADNFPYLQIRYRAQSGHAAELHWGARDINSNWIPGYANFSIISDGLWHVADINLSREPQWRERIVSFRYDPTVGSNGEVEIDYIRFSSSPASGRDDIVPHWEFDEADNPEGWIPRNSLSDFTVSYNEEISSGTLNTRLTGSDPFMSTSGGVDFSAATFPYVQIRYRATPDDYASAAPQYEAAQLYWGAKDANNAWISGVKNFLINADGIFHTATLDLSQEANWKERIVSLRYDPAVRADKDMSIEIDYVRFFNSRPAPEAPEWLFDIDGNKQGWSPNRQIGEETGDFEVEGGKLKMRVTGKDPFIFGPLGQEIDADTYKSIEIKLKIDASLDVFPSLKNAYLQLYWVREGEDFSQERYKAVPIGTDGVYTITMGPQDINWSGMIKRIRIDPVAYLPEFKDGVPAGDIRVEVDYIKVRETPSVDLSLSPAEGDFNVGSEYIFKTTYIDNSAREDIAFAEFLISDGTKTIRALYVPADGKLRIIDDDGRWSEGFDPESANRIENRYGTLNCSRTKVYTIGTTGIGIDWAFRFNDEFAGPKDMSLAATERVGSGEARFLGWFKKGSINIIEK